MAPYWAEYDAIGIDADARSSSHFTLARGTRPMGHHAATHRPCGRRRVALRRGGRSRPRRSRRRSHAAARAARHAMSRTTCRRPRARRMPGRPAPAIWAPSSFTAAGHPGSWRPDQQHCCSSKPRGALSDVVSGDFTGRGNTPPMAQIAPTDARVSSTTNPGLRGEGDPWTA